MPAAVLTVGLIDLMCLRTQVTLTLILTLTLLSSSSSL